MRCWSGFALLVAAFFDARSILGACEGKGI